MKDKLSVLNELFRPVIETMGFQLWGIEYVNQGRYSLLRIYLDKPDGVDVEDCAKVSKQLGSILDVEEPITGDYTLEVSSPGLDRSLFTLDQFNEFAGYHAKVRLSESFENRRNFTGQIKAVENSEVIMIIGSAEITLPFELIEKANIVSQV